MPSSSLSTCRQSKVPEILESCNIANSRTDSSRLNKDSKFENFSGLVSSEHASILTATIKASLPPTRPYVANESNSSGSSNRTNLVQSASDLNVLHQKEMRRAEEKGKDRLAQIAREKLGMISKEKQLQLERKKENAGISGSNKKLRCDNTTTKDRNQSRKIRVQ